MASLIAFSRYLKALRKSRIFAIFVQEQDVISITYNGGFHLHLLVFPFVYQFNSRIGVLVNSSFAND